MRTTMSRTSKGLLSLIVVAMIGIYSCNDSASNNGTNADTTVVAPSSMDTLPPPVLDTMPLPRTDTGRDTKVPRN